MSSKKIQIVALVVAYNRATLLRECLDALAAQTRVPDQIVVIDNASTDITAQVAKMHPLRPQVVTVSRNTGGAGGFALGIAHILATNSKANFIWIMDDDTIPTPSALSELLKAQRDYRGQVAVLSSQAVWTDGSIHPMNTHRPRPLLNIRQVREAKRIGAVSVRAASFVSILVDVRAIRADGLPQADYFIWNDDLEYTARLLRRRVGLHVPASVVLHKTKALASATEDPGERFFYEARNKVWFLRSASLHTLDRVLYGGSMLVRWAKMWLGSKAKADLFRRGRQGVWAGLTSLPRPNTQVLAGLGEISKEVDAIERQSQDTN